MTPDSAAADNFLSSKAPLYSTYHFFDVKNPKAVEAGTEQPIVEDVGPFKYQ